MLNDLQQRGLERYLDILENLSYETVSDLKECFDDRFRFVDPFNDVQGVEAGLAIFADIFDRADKVLFEVDRFFYGDQGVIVGWKMTLEMKKSRLVPKVWTFTGVSEIKVSSEGKILHHIDYWDASSQFYEVFPLIGPAIRFIKRKVSIT